MAKLKAGRSTVDLTEDQLDKLGVDADAEPLGCGTQACAYAGRDPDSVVKLTHDLQDAMTSYILMSVPEAGSGWAVPVHDVFEVTPKTWAVVEARAEPLTEPWKQAIDLLFTFADESEVGLDPDDWDEFYESLREALLDADGEDVHYELRGAGLDVAAADVTFVRHALEVVNEATLGFRKVGFAWVDSHSGNFGIYRGRPVVIDLGMSFPTDRPPVEQL